MLAPLYIKISSHGSGGDIIEAASNELTLRPAYYSIFPDVGECNIIGEAAARVAIAVGIA